MAFIKKIDGKYIVVTRARKKGHGLKRPRGYKIWHRGVFNNNSTAQINLSNITLLPELQGKKLIIYMVVMKNVK
jgi:hypothetical protein